MDGDLEAGMDPLRDPCAQAAVCRAEVTSSRRVAQKTSEMPPCGGIAVGDSRRCEIHEGASATLVVAVVAATVRPGLGRGRLSWTPQFYSTIGRMGRSGAMDPLARVCPANVAEIWWPRFPSDSGPEGRKDP